MISCKIISTGTVSRCMISMAHHLRQRGIITPVSLTNFPRIHFSSGPGDKVRFDKHDTGEHHKHQHQHQHQLEEQYEDNRPHRTQGNSSQRETPNRRHSSNDTSEVDNPSQLRPSKKKWRAPFWVPPPSSATSSSSSQPKNNRNRYKRHGHKGRRRSVNRFRNASLPVRQHLDPNRSMDLPTSDWVQIFGSLPMTSLEEVLHSIESILRKETVEGDGIIDLDAEWNPHRDGEEPPLVPTTLDYVIENSDAEHRREYILDKVTDNQCGSGNSLDGDTDSSDNDRGTTLEMECFRVVKAHVVLSPFGRPTGWNLKLANPSMVHALLSVARNARVRGSLRIGWKFARVGEHHPPPAAEAAAGGSPHDPDDTRTMLVVNDSMVRFENCPDVLTEDHLRHMLSRYELTRRGSTILRWRGRTSDGRVPPLTFVVRFACPANARAAVREMQGKILEGRPMKLIQYPRQLL